MSILGNGDHFFLFRLQIIHLFSQAWRMISTDVTRDQLGLHISFHVNCTCYWEVPVPLFTRNFNIVLVRKSGSDKGESARYHYGRVSHCLFSLLPSRTEFINRNCSLKKLRCLLTFCDVLRSLQGFCWSVFKACPKQGSKTRFRLFQRESL